MCAFEPFVHLQNSTKILAFLKPYFMLQIDQKFSLSVQSLYSSIFSFIILWTFLKVYMTVSLTCTFFIYSTNVAAIPKELFNFM